MFCFERAVIFTADKFHHRADKAIEVLRVCIRVESLVDQEMQVAIFCMPEHNAILITKIREELLQVCYRVRETMDGKGDIFIDAGSPWRTHGADGWDDAFSRFPKRDLLDGVICKIGIM